MQHDGTYAALVEATQMPATRESCDECPLLNPSWVAEMNVETHLEWPHPTEKPETLEEHARWIRSFFSQKEWDHLQAREQAEQSELEMARLYPEMRAQLIKQASLPRMKDAFSSEEYYEEQGDVEHFIEVTEQSNPLVETPPNAPEEDEEEDDDDAWVDEDPHPYLDEGDEDSE